MERNCKKAREKQKKKNYKIDKPKKMQVMRIKIDKSWVKKCEKFIV